MALDVNGYNSRFRSFVEFAQQRVDANDAKAVIDAKILADERYSPSPSRERTKSTSSCARSKNTP